jgi:hypothetical protein
VHDPDRFGGALGAIGAAARHSEEARAASAAVLDVKVSSAGLAQSRADEMAKSSKQSD